jgi:hypothetical protein
VPFILEDNFTTSGEVWITLQCHQAATNITVNINDIEVVENSVKVTQLHPKEDLRIQVCVVKGTPFDTCITA